MSDADPDADAVPAPSAEQAAGVQRLADALFDLLQERAQSWGMIDVELEPAPEAWHVGCELMFATGPAIGVNIDAHARRATFCELVDATTERWCDEPVVALPDAAELDAEEAAREHALAIADGVIATRRELQA